MEPPIPMIWELPPDRMTTPERMLAVSMGKKPDRVPFLPFVFGFVARNLGWDVATVYEDAHLSFTAQVRCQEQFGYDAGPLYGYASCGAWEFGGTVKMPHGEFDQAPTVTQHPVETEEDVDRVRVPDDVMNAGAVPIMFEFSKLQDAAGMPVSVQLGSPFTTAANMVQTSTLLKWMVRKPDLVHRLLRLQTDFFLEVARLWTEAFPGRFIMGFDGGPTESNDLISKEQFERFALPYMREVHEKALAMGVTQFFTHACGEQNANLPLYRDVPFAQPGISGMFSVGHEVDLNDAIDVMGDTCAILGNVEPAEILTSPPERVWDLTREAIGKAKYAPRGYLLMAGCDVPVQAPPYNLFTMVKCCKAYGQYD